MRRKLVAVAALIMALTLIAPAAAGTATAVLNCRPGQTGTAIYNIPPGTSQAWATMEDVPTGYRYKDPIGALKCPIVRVTCLSIATHTAQPGIRRVVNIIVTSPAGPVSVWDKGCS